MMNGKLKKAPNLKEIINQNLPAQQEIFILIGANVWGFYRNDPKNNKTNGTGLGWQLLADRTDADNPNRYNELPIVLDERELDKVQKIELLPANHEVASLIDVSGFFALKSSKDGVNIRENQEILTALCEHLALSSQVKTLLLKDNIGQMLEDLSGYIERIRNNNAVTLTAEPEFIELDAETLKKSTASEKAEYFYKWLKKPLAYHAEQGLIYGYNGVIWQILNENELLRKIKVFYEEYGAKYGNVTTLKNIIECLNVDLPLFETTTPDLLAFKNGVLNKNTLAFLPHSKDYFLTAVNNCDYLDRKLPTPNFDKWLNFISDNNEDRRKAILAALYMILNNRYEWQLTLELIGEPGSGKSTFLEIAKLITGEGNYAAIDLEILKDPKAIDIILNKTFLFSADQAKYIGDASVIKKISGGDDITFNPKNKKSFSSKVQAIIAICSNTLPIYKNDGGGMERRRVVFPFYHSVSEEQKDDKLIQKIALELGGVIRKLYDEFPQAEDAKKALLIQKNSKEALELKRKNDHILAFIDEFDLLPNVTNEGLIFGDARKLPSYDSDLIFQRIYHCYLLFCTVTGISDKGILTPSHLREELRLAFKTIGHKYIFSERKLAGGYNHTNLIFKDIKQTKLKWQSH